MSAILEATAEQPWHGNELRLLATTDRPATIAALCTLDADAGEAHLVEDSTPSTGHALRITGLLNDADYTCRLFPTCPRAVVDPLSLQVHTAPGPDELPEIEVESWGWVEPRAILTNWVDALDYSTGLLLIYDQQGRLRWWYRTPEDVGPSLCFEHAGGTQLAWGGGWPPIPEGRPRLLELTEGEVWDSGTLMADAEIARFHHDGKRLEDGRWATLEQLKVSSGGTEFYGFQARILNPETGATDLQYSAQRAVDEGHLAAGSGDAWHTNWVEVATLGGRELLLLSLRNLSQIIAVDASTGDWAWTFGAGGDFTLLDPEGEPLGDEGFPSWIHGPELNGDELLVYDNGVEATRSRVVAYRLDVEDRTATLLWSWTEESWYEAYLGSVSRLPDGHVLIGRGHGEPYSPSPGDPNQILEIDPTSGEKLWQLTWPDTADELYRASWADPCALFANAATCPAVAARLSALEAGGLITP